MDNETKNEQAPKPDGMAQAYKLHKNIGQIQDKVKRVQDEIKRTHLAAKLAFVGTLVVYFCVYLVAIRGGLMGFCNMVKG